MENSFKNEMLIKLAGEEILLRPTFENISAMESDLGGIAYLAFKYGQGVNSETGEVDQMKSALAMPSMSETAKIIFYNQAEKKFTKSQIFDLCLKEGIKICGQVIIFLVRITAGNKFQPEATESQKKS